MARLEDILSNAADFTLPRMRLAVLSFVFMTIVLSIYSQPALADPLHEYSKAGDVEQVQKLLDIDPTLITSQDSNGWTALHWAAWTANVRLAKLLISRFAPLDTQNTSGQTALMLAVQKGDPKFVSYLLSRNPNLIIHGPNDFGLVHVFLNSAASPEILEMLLKKGAPLDERDGNNCTPLIVASKSGRLSVVEMLLQYNANVNMQDQNGWNALIWSIEQRRTKTARRLIEVGTLLSAADGNGWTALHHAVSLTDEISTKTLLDAKANLCSRDNRGFTPLMLAAQLGSTNMIYMLFQNKRQLNNRSTDGLTALHYAVENQKLAAVDMLIKLGASVNSTDQEPLGLTALHQAVQNKQIDVVKALIENGANPFIKNQNGKSAHDLATENGFVAAVTLFQEIGRECF